MCLCRYNNSELTKKTNISFSSNNNGELKIPLSNSIYSLWSVLYVYHFETDFYPSLSLASNCLKFLSNCWHNQKIFNISFRTPDVMKFTSKLTSLDKYELTISNLIRCPWNLAYTLRNTLVYNMKIGGLGFFKLQAK